MSDNPAILAIGQIKYAIIAILLLFAACSQPADAPGIPFVQKKTNGGLENAYYVSYAFDSCGDSETGQRYRDALRTRADACALPPASAAAFARATKRMDEIMPQKIGAFHTEFGDHPEKSGDYQCSDILAMREATLASATTAGCGAGANDLAGPAQVSVPPPKSPPPPPLSK